jgi:hypothetical protein
VPPEGDWFTRLLQRWEEVQQRIEKLDQPRYGGQRIARGVNGGDAEEGDAKPR